MNEEETGEGAGMVGGPVVDSVGRALAAISVSTLTVRCSGRKREGMIRAVRNAAAAVSADLAGLGFLPIEAGKAVPAGERRAASALPTPESKTNQDSL